MRYHFEEAIGPVAQRKPQCDAFTGATDGTSYGLAEFLGVAAQLGAEVTLVSPWADGSPQRAAAMVAYANGDPSSTVALGADADGVDWGTAGDWARKRVRDGHPASWAVKMLEIGNEPYSDLSVGPPVSCGRPGPFRQDERWVAGMAVPTTAADYASQLVATAALVRAVDSHVRIGAAAYSSYDGVSDAAREAGDVDRVRSGDAWDARLMSDAAGAFDVFVLHPYDLTLAHSAVTLGARLAKTIQDLRALAPSKGIAITEFGSLRGGGTLTTVVLAADVVRVAILAGAEMVLRHVLVEDTPDEPFAQSAAVLGPAHATTPGYSVMQLLATTLSGHAVPTAEAAPGIEATAFRTDAGGLALLLVDRREDASASTDVTVSLPAGSFHGTLHVLQGDSLDATVVARVDTAVSAQGSIQVALPPNGVAVLELGS
jgi:alpha-L-arabinofuranosidase